MPRICTSANDPLDFCSDCFPDRDRADVEYGDIGDGPDGRGNCFDYDAHHPRYECAGYSCEDCGGPLGVQDN